MGDLTWIAPTAASISAMVIAIIAAVRSKDNGQKVDAVKAGVEIVTSKVETVLEKTAEIHATTNGTLHQAVAATEAANSLKSILEEKVEGLVRELAALKLSGALAAAEATKAQETAVIAARDVREAQTSIPLGSKPESSARGES